MRMAHTPERPEKYICAECQVLHAGAIVSKNGGDHRYEAPERCGCCGATELVPQERWVHFNREEPGGA